jgi:hypothetical protein
MLLISPPAMTSQVWGGIIHVVENEFRHRLFQGRHVDQILVCALLADCRRRGIDQFGMKELLDIYKRQPHYSGNDVRYALYQYISLG